jgi:hypothetical protein
MTQPSAIPSAGGEQVNPIPSLTPEPPGTKNQSRHGSKVSVATHSSRRSHKKYLDTLMCPTPQQVERISDVQTQKEKEISQKRLSGNYGELDSEERERAAELIQRLQRRMKIRLNKNEKQRGRSG